MITGIASPALYLDLLAGGLGILLSFFRCRIFGLRRWTPEVRAASGLCGMLTMVESAVEDDAEGAKRLASPLRSKAKQDDVTLAVANIQSGSETVDVLLT